MLVVNRVQALFGRNQLLAPLAAVGIGVSLLAGIVGGVAPAITAARVEIVNALRQA